MIPLWSTRANQERVKERRRVVGPLLDDARRVRVREDTSHNGNQPVRCCAALTLKQGDGDEGAVIPNCKIGLSFLRLGLIFGMRKAEPMRIEPALL